MFDYKYLSREHLEGFDNYKVLSALSFYASGSYQRYIGASAHHKMTQASVSNCVRSVTLALNNDHFRNKYIRFPQNQEERNVIKQRFYQKYGMPGVLGCIDGTHIAIVRPAQYEERFFNRKRYHSLNAQIVCDADLNILNVDASHGGANHDSFVWSYHPLKAHLDHLHQAENETVWFLGDSGYALRATLLTPILGCEPNSPQEYYNELHCRVRNTVERCIGVLKSRWRCLLIDRKLHYHPTMAGFITNACVVLHNIANNARLPMTPLSQEEEQNEAALQYMSKDTSPLSVYVMHPFWNKVVELIPRWVAPNVLTFAGFILTVLDFALLSYYDYDYTAASSAVRNETTVEPPLNGHTERIPQSLWYALAVFLFLAYTLDGIDGKQARRTQTSGPLGELFDHGLDSYSVFFIPACLYSIFGRLDFSIPPIRMYYVMWNLLFNFYISHWEKYNTGVLFLPWGYDFSMWASTFIFLWTGVNGTGFYKRYLFGGYTLANGFEWLIYATGVFTNLPVALYNVYLSYKENTGKMRSPLEAMRPLWSLLSVFLLCSLWASRGSLADRDPRALFLLVGTVFSNVACRLIVSQMSNQRCELVNGLLWPLSVAIGFSMAFPQYELLSFYVITVISVAAHIHYGACVVRQMCDHFRISCFHIKQRSD